jgi:formylglycine-generating enzyme
MKIQIGILMRVAFAALLLALPPNLLAQDARYFRISGPVATTITEFRPDGTLVWTNTPTNTTFTVQMAISLGGESNWVDYVQIPVTNGVNTNRLVDFNPPIGMALIPAGSFLMGDTHGDWPPEWVPNPAIPAHSVYVSAFYMDRHEVTKGLWDEVYNWAITHGYSFDHSDSGQGKAANHPAHTMTWYDAVKWCNARSEKAGFTPAYYTSSAQTTVYRTGQINVENEWVKWQTGYRLATEAEWEKAARGGNSGLRFPWGNTISHSQANYNSYWSGGFPYYPFDLNPIQGYHPTFNNGVSPYTSPVGYFAPNGYGLYEMSGNVWEWCWDWWSSSYYGSSSLSDPRGPASGSYRVFRGGGWGGVAVYCWTAYRSPDYPTGRYTGIGFRCVRPAGQ